MSAVILACNLSTLQWSRELTMTSIAKKRREWWGEWGKERIKSYLKGHVLRSINVYIINDVIKISIFIIPKFLL